MECRLAKSFTHRYAPIMHQGEPCRVYPGRQCWDCIEAFREMIQRLATGATVHTLNNEVMQMVGACHRNDREAWERGVHKFMQILKSGSRN